MPPANKENGDPITITASTATIVSVTEVFEEDDVPIVTVLAAGCVTALM